MRLSEVQSWVLAHLQADTNLSGASFIADDGSYPLMPQRDAALNDTGLLIVVWQQESEGFLIQSTDGTTILLVAQHIVIEENQAVCRSQSGANIRGDEAVEYVLKRMAGASDKPESRQAFQLLDPGFRPLGKKDGISRWVVSATITIPIAGNIAS